MIYSTHYDITGVNNTLKTSKTLKQINALFRNTLESYNIVSCQSRHSSGTGLKYKIPIEN